MKKNIVFFLIVVSLFVIFPVSAANDVYHIKGFYVDATLNEDGSMNIEERITYYFDGKFNGIFRSLGEAGSDGIEDIEVSIDSNGTIVNAELNQDGGPDGTYQILDEVGGKRLKIFSKSLNEEKHFIIKYKVLNAATKYNDIGELYWKFIGIETDDLIENFHVSLWLPEGAEKSEIKAFAHGPLTGIVEINSSQNIILEVEKLPPNTFVEGRILFPVNLIKESSKKIDKDALGMILEEEGRWAEEANAKRRRARMWLIIPNIFVILEILAFIFIYFKYDKEFSGSFKGKYYRELPGEYSPAVMSVLWNFGKIKPIDITATLMDLVRKKHLLMEVEAVEKKKIFRVKEETDYVFTLNDEIKKSDLSKHEKYFLDWLVGKVGNGKSVSLNGIQTYTKDKSNAITFKQNYDKWSEDVKIDSVKYEFFDKSVVKAKKIGIIISVLGSILGAYTLVKHEIVSGSITLLLTSFALVIYSAILKRRSKYGVDQYKKWKAFKMFLKHFSRLSKAEIPSIVIWEHYLVYAISLGVAKEVLNQLKVTFRNEDFNNDSLTYMHYGLLSMEMNRLYGISNSINSAVKYSESTYKKAMSKESSSSGGGGGFSGGGGGGGGGGGTGAF